MNKKSKYRNFCENNKNLPLFLNDWWLDAVAGEKNWNVAIIEKANEIFGVLPYTKTSKYGFAVSLMPMFTQHLGVWITYPEGQKYYTRLSFEKEIIQDLLNQLPDFHYISFENHYQITNWLPFYWKHFSETTKYTYVIGDLEDIERVYSNLSSSTKKNVKKASKLVKVIESDDISLIYSFNEQTFKRQGKNIPYTLDQLNKLDINCKERNCRKIFIATDNQNQIHASLYLVWNEQCAYYLIGGADPKLRNSEAMTLLMWEAIKFASTVSKKFDFEGSMIESVERFFRGFGAEQKPYFKLKKYNSKLLKIIIPLLYHG